MGAYADLLADIEQPPSSGGSVQQAPGVEGFIKMYAPVAERVAAQTGNDPSLYLAQWGLETGWGKSIIPGTNNLGNIKDFSGSGVAARDNMTGSKDNYRKYETPLAFADDFAGLLGRKYKGAMNVGSDPVAYATALKQNGYAEDAAYVNKIKAAHNMVASRYSGKPASIDDERTEPRVDYASAFDKYKNTPLRTLDEQVRADGVRESIAKGRTWGDFATDSGAALLKGAGNFAESMGGLYNLISGEEGQNMAQTGGKALSDFAEAHKSEFIKNQEKLSQQDIDQAEGHFNKFVTAAGGVLTNPALAANFLLEQGVNFIPGMAAGRIAKGIIAGLGGASAAAIEAAPLAQKAMLLKRLETAGQVGTGISVATGAVLQGADAGNSAYQQMMARPQAEWDADTEYQQLVTTLGTKGAKHKIALDESRAAFLKSGGVSAILNAASPAHSIDKMLVNGIKNRTLPEASRAVAAKLANQGAIRATAAGAGKAFVGEAASEGFDEGYGQYAANEAEARINPNKDVLDQVAENAGLGAAFGPVGAMTGGVEGYQRRKLAQEAVASAPVNPLQEAAAKPNSPLSRAAAAANLPAIDPRAQPAVLGEAPRGAAMADRSGPDALEGEYMPADGGDKPLLESPGAMIDRHGNIVHGGPNFTMTGEGESPTTAKGNRERKGAASYALGAPRAQLTYQEQQVVSAAEVEYEAAYADMVKAEQLGAGDQELMQRQMALRQAEARLQEIQRTIDGNRQLDSAAKRDALLGNILDTLPPGQNPSRAFDRALRDAGFNDTKFSEAERAKIEQWQQLSDGFMQQQAEPSNPNQLDAGAVGIKEKQEFAPGTPGAKLREVDAMLKAGMVRRGPMMFNPKTGKSVKLSPAQIARAKKLEADAKEKIANDLPATEQVAQEATQANDAQVGAEQAAAPQGEVSAQNLQASAQAKPDGFQVQSIDTQSAPVQQAEEIPVSDGVGNVEKRGIKTIDRWTAGELQARLDRGNLSAESEKRLRDELAKRPKPKQSMPKKTELTIGKTPNSAEPVTVRNGVVYVGDYPALDYETEADITVPEGASQQQIVDALRNGGAIGSRKVFGLKAVADQNPIKNEMPSVAKDSGVSVGKNQSSIKKADRPGAEDATAPEKSEASNLKKQSDGKTDETSEALAREMSGFAGVSDIEYQLRQMSQNAKRQGDIELGNGKFITLEQAVSAAKKHMDKSDWGKPFQFSRVLDIAPIDWNRMVEAMKGADAQTSQNSSNNTTEFKTVSEEFDFNDAKWRIDVHESKFEPGTLAWTGYKNGVKVNESAIPLRVAKRAYKFYERVVDGLSLLRGGASVPTEASGANPLAEQPPNAGAAAAMTPGQSSDSNVAHATDDDKTASMQDKIDAAAERTAENPSPAQIEADNFAQGKFPWNGLRISIETAKDGIRRDKETNGDKWQVTMPAHYGKILGTTGADGDHVDVFVGEHPESDQVFIINQTQVNSDAFDEHKVLIGYQDAGSAKADYLSSFSDGFGSKVFGSLEGPFSVDEFKQMLPELEKKRDVDKGRRLNERTKLSDITVTVEAVEAETGRTVEMEENAADALKDVDDRMKLARSLLECLAS